jgi:hypothetical protein
VTRSPRDIFNDHVTVLVRQLGFELDQLDERDVRRLLAEAWHRKLGDHEAAASVGYGYVRSLLQRDLERARVLLDRMSLVVEQWRALGLVDRSRTVTLEQEARRAVREAAG